MPGEAEHYGGLLVFDASPERDVICGDVVARVDDDASAAVGSDKDEANDDNVNWEMTTRGNKGIMREGSPLRERHSFERERNSFDRVSL